MPIFKLSTSNTLQQASEKTTAVVYGLYDSKSQPFSVRLHDFFVDRHHVGIQDKSYFFHLLAVMLDAGIPIMKSLKILSKKTENERFSRIINTMAYDVERGKTMSQSMTKFPDVFEESEVGVVRSGEAIGNLSQLLFRLAEQTQRTHELYLKVRGALIYPATVLAALFVSGGIVVTMVLPRLRDFFEQGNYEMPLITNLILNVGGWLVSVGWFIAVGLVFGMLLLSVYMRSEDGKRRLDMMSLNIYGMRDVVRKYNVARFVQLLSLLVAAGVPIHQAIEISAGAMSNLVYRDFILSLKEEVEKGEKIAENLAEAPFLFPEAVTAMVSVGENTGQLSQIADKLAKHYEREVEHALENFVALLEPIVIVFVGLAVAVLALALLGPIFSLSTTVTV